MKLLLMLAAAGFAQGAVYTVCHAGPPACQFSRVQDAIDAAHFGDTIKLKAGETFNGFKLRYKSGTSAQPIVITTTRDGELPLPGTRITPAYAMGSQPVTARVRGNGSGAPTITTDNGRAAHDYVLAGLEILPDPKNPYDAVQIGPVDASERVTSEDGLPYNITLDRVYVHGGRLEDIRRCITPHGRNVVIENSWISDCHQRGIDSQAIEAWNTPGPLRILNNYLDASTEVISFGGAPPSIAGTLMHNVEIAYNHITRPDYYLPGTWRAGAWFERGKIISPAHSNGWHYVAETSGTSGSSEPAWPARAGATVRDGGITWKADTGGPWLVKNLVESKSSDGLRIHHNLLEKSPGASQFHAIVLTVRTGQSGSWARVWHTDIESNTVREVDGLLNTLGLDGLDPELRAAWRPEIKVGAGERVVPRAGLGSGYQYRAAAACLTGSAEPAWPAAPGRTVADGTCAWAAEPLSPGAWLWTPDGPHGTTRYLTLHNNLLYRSGSRSAAGAPGDTTPVIGLNHAIGDFTADHNTFAFEGSNFITAAGYPGYGGRLTNNLVAPSTYGMSGWTYDGKLLTRGGAFVPYWLCNDPASPAYPDPHATCPAGAVAHNVFAGAEGEALPPGNWATAWDKIGFTAAAAGDFTLTRRSPFAGKDVGADVSRLPLIRDLKVTAADRTAVFSFEVTSPIAGMPCMLRVSTSPAMEDTVADLDPSRFTRPDAVTGGASRSITVGRNAPLAPATSYWYYLGCAGDARSGEFRTAAGASSGPRMSAHERE